jgi:hypothetical protein
MMRRRARFSPPAAAAYLEGRRMRNRMTRLAAGLLVVLAALLAGVPLAAARAPDQARIYLVAPGDDGQSGVPVGCGDSLVPVTVETAPAATTEARIAAALAALFALKEPAYGQSGLANALYRSSLTVDRVELQGGVAAVYLSGALSVGGVCDEPRAEGQIVETARQFPGLSAAIVIYRGGPLFSPPRMLAFAETGHALASPFLQYWLPNGGLPVFGYPLTDQRVEGGLRVQYFERARFEHHPENAPPYHILFSLIGAQTAQREGLVATPPFARQARGDNPNCEYIAQTGHHLCFGFRAYWHAHGLDFGDPGVSARESLALFGYPLSEEFRMTLEDGREYTVQYFERARLEWHPENAPPYDVLLSRLGAALLTPPGP